MNRSDVSIALTAARQLCLVDIEGCDDTDDKARWR